jgi:hypothetical protein
MPAAARGVLVFLCCSFVPALTWCGLSVVWRNAPSPPGRWLGYWCGQLNRGRYGKLVACPAR